MRTRSDLLGILAARRRGPVLSGVAVKPKRHAMPTELARVSVRQHGHRNRRSSDRTLRTLRPRLSPLGVGSGHRHSRPGNLGNGMRIRRHLRRALTSARILHIGAMRCWQRVPVRIALAHVRRTIRRHRMAINRRHRIRRIRPRTSARGRHSGTVAPARNRRCSVADPASTTFGCPSRIWCRKRHPIRVTRRVGWSHARRHPGSWPAALTRTSWSRGPSPSAQRLTCERRLGQVLILRRCVTN